MTDLDPREHGLAPRMIEPSPLGACYTMAGVMALVGVSSKTTFYTMHTLVQLRRDFSDGAVPRWRWLKTDVEQWIAGRPKGKRSGPSKLAARMAKVGEGATVKRKATRSKYNDGIYARMGANPGRPLTDYLEAPDAR